MNDDLRFPIGQPERHQYLRPEQRLPLIENVAQLPGRLGVAIGGLTAGHLDTPYRPGGWTVRQVVHHFADSHMNAFVRFKLALTEDAPTVKTYQEARWAETVDARMPPIELSLTLLESLHARWVLLMRS
ncbi:MAG: YfiT family bacillithiol transferase, partial [Candidatus Acidiferrales bacterium]